MYKYDNISHDSSYNEKCFGQICKENENTHFIVNNFFSPSKVVPLMR